ncbi:hypothetical protein AB0958_18920 [Streptomyces sp. NPDC006655]
MADRAYALLRDVRDGFWNAVDHLGFWGLIALANLGILLVFTSPR